MKIASDLEIHLCGTSAIGGLRHCFCHRLRHHHYYGLVALDELLGKSSRSYQTMHLIIDMSFFENGML